MNFTAEHRQLEDTVVKFCDKDHGLVRLDAQRDGTFLRVSVQDNGIGIAEQDQDKIFERFQQAGDTLTDKPQGTGLGLSLSYDIIRAHGGEMKVETKQGEYAQFIIIFPYKQQII